MLIDRVIRSLGTRVEQEHTQHLRDVRRIEQQAERFNPQPTNGSSFGLNGNNGEIDFESLVKGSSPAPPDVSSMSSPDSWDEGWLNAGSDATLVSCTSPNWANRRLMGRPRFSLRR